MRFVLLHHHIFKNAGSSVDAALARHFGQGFSEFHPAPHENGRVPPALLFEYLDINDHIHALSSHHFFGRDFERELDPLRKEKYYFFDCIILRHPISRLVSMYVYYIGIPRTDNPISDAAHNLSFPDFLKLIMWRHPNFAVNPQVTMFGCDHYAAPPSNKNFHRALGRLEKVAILGTVEEYTKTMVVAEYFLQPVFSGLQIHSSRQNVSKHEALPGYDGSLKFIENMVGEQLFSQFCNMNALDILLLKAVTDELDRRASYVPDFDIRYENFLERCS